MTRAASGSTAESPGYGPTPKGKSPRAAIAARIRTKSVIDTAHMARVTGLVRSRFTSDAVRTPPEADPLPTVQPQYGFFATIAAIARKNHSGENHGHQKPAMTIAKLNRSPVRTSPTQIASSAAVLMARVSRSPRDLMRAESSTARFGTSAANTSGKSSITPIWALVDHLTDRSAAANLHLAVGDDHLRRKSFAWISYPRGPDLFHARTI